MRAPTSRPLRRFEPFGSAVSPVEIQGQNAGAGREREIGEAGFELGHLARHRARALRIDERVVAAVEERARVAQRLPQAPRTLDGHEVREVVHVCALVLVVEKVIGGGERHQITPVLAEGNLDQTDVEV